MPEDPEDDFCFGRKTPQSCNWGDIEASELNYQHFTGTARHEARLFLLTQSI
jgi:hypothetical protein